MVGSTPEDAVHGNPKQPAPPRKKGGRTPRGDIGKASQSQSKGKSNKKAKPAANVDLEDTRYQQSQDWFPAMKGPLQWHRKELV